MSVVVIGSFPLGGINLAANGSVSLAGPALKQLDLALTSPFGLGSIVGDLRGQLQAALSAQKTLAASLIVQVGFAAQLKATLSLQAQLAALIKAQASLTFALSSLPALNLQITGSIAAAAALSAKLAVRVSGIKSLVSAGLSAKIQAVDFFADLSAQLSAGPVVLLSIGNAGSNTLASAGSELDTLFSSGVGGIAPGDTVYGLVLVTKSASAWAAISATMKTS